MQLPPKDADTLFEELLQDLPPDIEGQAREFKAFCRARKVRTPKELLRIVFLYCGLDKTLRDTAMNFTLLYERISDSSIAERLQSCGPWVKAMLMNMVKVNDLSWLPKQMRFLVMDGSAVQAPGARGTDYRIHILMDLIELRFVHIQVTDKHTAESLRLFSLGKGDVAMADRAYAYADPIVETVNKGADLILRISAHNLPFYDTSGERIEVANQLKGQQIASIRSFEVVVKSRCAKRQITGYLHAYRLTEEEANKARRRIRRRSQKNGETPKEQTLVLAGWVLVFTTISPEILSAETILKTYRVRWQVEIAIKRWKSILKVGELRAKQASPLAEVWMAGKLLYALMIEKRGRKKVGESWSRLDRERKATFWRVWKIIKDEVSEKVVAARYWRKEGWSECLDVMRERPRRRKLQGLPEEVIGVYLRANTRLEEDERKVA